MGLSRLPGEAITAVLPLLILVTACSCRQVTSYAASLTLLASVEKFLLRDQLEMRVITSQLNKVLITQNKHYF